MKIKNEWWTCTFYPFYNFRTSKDLEILRQSSYMSHILKGLGKRNTHIPHIVLYDEEKWQKMCSNANFGFFYGWRTFLESDPKTVVESGDDSCIILFLECLKLSNTCHIGKFILVHIYCKVVY